MGDEKNWENQIHATAMQYLLEKGKRNATKILVESQPELNRSPDGWFSGDRYLTGWHLYLRVPIKVKDSLDEQIREEISEAYKEALGVDHYLRDLHVEIRKTHANNNWQKEVRSKLETWDLFVCHASEDKTWVKKLANTLRARGWGMWYDEFELTLGDSLRRRIDHGLSKSRFGVVVLSKNFFNKEFPNRELDGLAAREINGKKVILPIWHGVSRQDVERYSPILADRVAVSSVQGIDKVVDEIERVIVGPDSPVDILQYRELSDYNEQIEMGIRILRDHRPIVRASVALDLGFRCRNLSIDYRKKIGDQLIPLLYDREPEVRGNGAWAIGELFKELPPKSREIVRIPLEFLLNDDTECREVDEDHVLHRSRVGGNARNALIKLGYGDSTED